MINQHRVFFYQFLGAEHFIYIRLIDAWKIYLLSATAKLETAWTLAYFHYGAPLPYTKSLKHFYSNVNQPSLSQA